MANIKIKDIDCKTCADLPKIGTPAPNFKLTLADFSTISLENFKDKNILFHVYPSLENETCHNYIKELKKNAAKLESLCEKSLDIIGVSMDLPFTINKYMQYFKSHDAILASDFRNRQFGHDYGVTICNGPLAGLLARAIILTDSEHRVIYTELIEDLTQKPNIQSTLDAIQANFKKT